MPVRTRSSLSLLLSPRYLDVKKCHRSVLYLSLVLSRNLYFEYDRERMELKEIVIFQTQKLGLAVMVYRVDDFAKLPLRQDHKTAPES